MHNGHVIPGMYVRENGVSISTTPDLGVEIAEVKSTTLYLTQEQFFTLLRIARIVVEQGGEW